MTFLKQPSLVPQRIAELLRDDNTRPQLRVRVVAETGSTNADLLAAVPSLAGPTLLITEHQTAGRGREGRSWHSTALAGLTFSLAWPCRRPLAGLAGLPLAIGVALADALDAAGVHTRLKWPNDVLLDGKKLAGILIETALPATGAQTVWAIIGIGLNLALPDAIAQHLDRPAAAATGLAQRDRAQLFALLADHLVDALMQFDEAGFAAFHQRWNARHAYAGREVVLLDRGQPLQEGRAIGVDERGFLLLDTAAGQVPVMAGDVSLRLRPDQEPACCS